jgi:hypothetical protein
MVCIPMQRLRSPLLPWLKRMRRIPSTFTSISEAWLSSTPYLLATFVERWSTPISTTSFPESPATVCSKGAKLIPAYSVLSHRGCLNRTKVAWRRSSLDSIMELYPQTCLARPALLSALFIDKPVILQACGKSWDFFR